MCVRLWLATWCSHCQLPSCGSSPHTSLCYIRNNSLPSSSVDSETSFFLSLIHPTHTLIIVTCPDESTQPEWYNVASTLTLRCRICPSISLFVHRQNKTSPCSSHSLSFSLSPSLQASLPLWWCDGKQVLYCKTVLICLVPYTLLLSAPAFKQK